MKLSKEQQAIINQHRGTIYIESQQSGTGLTEVLLQKAADEISKNHNVALLDCNFSVRWTNERISRDYGKNAAFACVTMDNFVRDHYEKNTLQSIHINNVAFRQLLKNIAQQEEIEPRKLIRSYENYLATGILEGDSVLKKTILNIEAWKNKHHYVELQDMYTTYQNDPALLRQLTSCYDCILIDHFHNAKPHHVQFVAALAKAVPLVMVGGNAYQSIVANGANGEPSIFELMNPTVLTLSRSFGISPHVSKFTNSLVNMPKPNRNVKNDNASPAPLYQSCLHWDHQGEFIVSTIHSLLKEGCDTSEIAVLSRLKAPLLGIKLFLEKQGIVCNSLFYKDKPYQQCTELLEVLVSIVRSMNFDNGLSMSDAAVILKFCGIEGPLYESMIERIQLSGLAGFCISRNQCSLHYGSQQGRKIADYLLAIYQALNEASDSTPAVGVQKLLDAIKPVIHNKFPDSKILMGLLSRIKLRYRKLTDWNQTGFILNDTYSNNKGIALCTQHMALGGRWKHVFIIHVVDGIHPFTKYKNDTLYETELALFYSTCTRASQQLYLLQTPYPKFNYVATDRASKKIEHSHLINESPFIAESKKHLTII